MCGIVGFYSPSGFSSDWAGILAQDMAKIIANRGPDDSGEWIDSEAGIALAHRRLSIMDISPAGHQPMRSASRRYVIVFNGEIYNHMEMRTHLVGPWCGHSDTETLLAGFECWGVEATLKKTVGMFAIALWDRQERVLTLARDRMGEKPFYYGWQGDTFLFGSELNAMRLHPAFRAEIERNTLPLYLRHGYITAPYTIFKGVQKLLPGSYLQLSCRLSPGSLPIPVPYWSLQEGVASGLSNHFTGSDEEAIETLERHLLKAVLIQQIADVPLGAFLSGGIDSSLVVALMQAQSSRPVKTFTIGFHNDSHNEAVHAKAVACHLGTEHTELYVTPLEALEVIPLLPSMYDEPFGDSSQIPTFLLSRMTRQEVTVALSGDGGDELFAGYTRYLRAESVWNRVKSIPQTLRGTMAKSIHMFSPEMLGALFNPFDSIKNGGPGQFPGERIHALADVLNYTDCDDFYWKMTSACRSPDRILCGETGFSQVLTKRACPAIVENFIERCMFQDTMQYLPDDILVKVDRATMAVSLEARVPMLDHRVVEFAWSLPFHMKIRDNNGKWILRQVLYKYVPKELIERPKMGFGVPIDAWLRGPLREWAEELLSEERLKKEGFFQPQAVRKIWAQHLSGRYNWQHNLWHFLMFQAWLTHNGKPRTI